MLWKVIVCWSNYEYKDVTRRSRERAKWQKKGRIRWGGGTEWRSRVTSRPRVHGLRCQWLKRTWKKKKQETLKGIVMQFCWIGVMQNFSHISPWHLHYNLYFSWLYCRSWIYFGMPCISSLRRVWSKNYSCWEHPNVLGTGLCVGLYFCCKMGLTYTYDF